MKLKGIVRRLEDQAAASFISGLNASQYGRFRSHGGWISLNNESSFVNIGTGAVTLVDFNRNLHSDERLSYDSRTHTVRITE
jgi:hypothetical protein